METHAGGRPHLGDIASGLIDARVSGVDFWDTDVGRRLLDWHRRGQPSAAPGPGAAPGPDAASRPAAGHPVAAPGRRRRPWSRRRRADV